MDETVSLGLTKAEVDLILGALQLPDENGDVLFIVDAEVEAGLKAKLEATLPYFTTAQPELPK